MTTNDNTTIVVDNITYCWHNDLGKYYYCDDILDDVNEYYQVTPVVVIFLFFLYLTTSFVSIWGNSLVIWVIYTTRSMQDVNNYFIANLALSDITISALCTPFQFYAALVQRWDLPEFMCKFCPFAQMLSVNVSIFTLLVISHDRYKAIMTPLAHKTSKTMAKVKIGLIWLSATILALPNGIFHNFDYVLDEFSEGGLKPFCTPEEVPKYQVPLVDYDYDYDDNENQTIYNQTIFGQNETNSNYDYEEPVFLTNFKIYIIINFVIQYGVPTLLLTYSYVRMGIRLWTNETPGNADNRRDEGILENKKKFIKMMAVIVGAFGICWLPWHFFHVVGMIYPTVMRHDYVHFFFFAGHWLAMSNSCINPFIYAIFSEKFKKEFKRKKNKCYLSCCGCHNPDDTRDIGLDPTAPVSQELPHGGQLTERTLSNGTRVHIIRPNPKREFSTKTETFSMSIVKTVS